MKKFYVLMSLLLVASMGFSQYYATKTNNAKPFVSKTDKVAQVENYMPKAAQAVIFEDGFETGDLAGWTLVDADGDGYNWSAITGEGSTTPHSGVYNVTSASWNGTDLHPENWLISPAIDLTTVTGTIMLEYWVRAQDQAWPDEHYKLVVSTTNTDIASFTTILKEETITAGTGVENNYLNRIINLSSYAGQTIYLAWVHYNCTGMFRINLDDISIYTSNTADAAITGITEPNHEGGCTLSATQNITITIQNYGSVDISNFDVSYIINGGTPVTETVTATIAPTEALNYTFTQKADLAAINEYTIVASVNLTDDANAANDSYTLKIVSGDAKITIHALTDNGGGQSWQVINNLTNEVVAERTAAWPWYVEITEDICVIDANCYTVIVSDDHGDGMVDGSAYLEILYDGTQVAGSTTPDSWTTATLTAENLGSGCAANDAQLESIETIYPACELGVVDIIVNVKNAGTADFSAFDVSYTVNGGTPVTESVTETVAAGATYQHTFTTQADLSEVGDYTIVATVTLTGDEIEANNSETIQTQNVAPASTPYSSGFDSNEELLGWAIENTNGDDSYFTIVDNYGVNNSQALVYPYSTTVDADDWAISRCIDLVGGTEYTVKIDYSVEEFYGSPMPEKLAIYYGDAQNSAAMTNLINDLGELTNVEYQTGAFNFTPEASGTYYIGFHCYSDMDNYLLKLDNFNIDIATNSNIVEASNISVYPNPANDFVTVANAENANIVIVNMLGEVVANVNNASSNQNIDISKLANGTYFVKVDGEVFKINVVK